MYRALADLRILRMALHLEETLERYEEYLRGLLPDVPYRARLAPLFKVGGAHQRLRQEFEDLQARARSLESRVDPRDILQAIDDCEDIAHDFYLRHLDRLSDPRLVELFRDLAAEELIHGTIVKEVMRTGAEARPNHRSRKPRPSKA